MRLVRYDCMHCEQITRALQFAAADGAGTNAGKKLAKNIRPACMLLFHPHRRQLLSNSEIFPGDLLYYELERSHADYRNDQP
jgi:hypothetical protein